MKTAVFACMILGLSGCLATPDAVSRAPTPPPPGISPEKLWMTGDGFRVRLNDGTTCYGSPPVEGAMVSDERPGWSGQLTRCAYVIDYHIVRRDLYGLDALDQALSTSNILFGTFKNGPNWQLCLQDVPDESGDPTNKCASQPVRGG